MKLLAPLAAWPFALLVQCAVASGPPTPTVQPIVTKAMFGSGRVVENHGVGIVVGNLFVTVYHNLDPQYVQGRYRLQSYLAGYPVAALAIDKSKDIAVILIPPSLCSEWCNGYRLPNKSTIGLQQTVAWVENRQPPSSVSGRASHKLETFDAAPHVAATVLSFTARGGSSTTLDQASAAEAQAHRTECQRGLVVEVSKPFKPGSSGTAVWDTLTQQLLGMAQGSFEFASGAQTGYFTPVRCIFEHLDRFDLTN